LRPELCDAKAFYIVFIAAIQALIRQFDESDGPVQVFILAQSGVSSLELQPDAALHAAEVRQATEAAPDSGLRTPDFDTAV